MIGTERLPTNIMESFTVATFFLLLLTNQTVTSFIPSTKIAFGRKSIASTIETPTVLLYANITAPGSVQLDPIKEKRDHLKKELVLAAIENYDIDAYTAGMTTIAEDIMKKLEPIRPIEKSALDSTLNARWSFVFTGVPTIGMRLITILSRVSVGFPPVDFRDVFLELYNKQSMVKAIVSCKVFGKELELNVFTSLKLNETDVGGTFMIEKFEGITLAGIDIPTPESWHKERDLEISYLDDDMMIARTAGGEPHLLLRHSTCSTDDLECDVDAELTNYFIEAKSKYGASIARCLVDRQYGETREENYESLSPILNLVNFKPFINTKRK